MRSFPAQDHGCDTGESFGEDEGSEGEGVPVRGEEGRCVVGDSGSVEGVGSSQVERHSAADAGKGSVIHSAAAAGVEEVAAAAGVEEVAAAAEASAASAAPGTVSPAALYIVTPWEWTRKYKLL